MKAPFEDRMVVATADIDGFTRGSRGRSNVEVFQFLDRFYEIVGDVVASAGGTVVKFLGDGALLAFPEDRARQAVATLESLKARVRPLFGEWDPSMSLRIRAHVGPVACGPIGPGKRFDVIGKCVSDLFRMAPDAPELSEDLRKVVAAQEPPRAAPPRRYRRP